MNELQNELRKQIDDAKKKIEEAPKWMKATSKFQGSEQGETPQPKNNQSLKQAKIVL